MCFQPYIRYACGHDRKDRYDRCRYNPSGPLEQCAEFHTSTERARNICPACMEQEVLVNSMGSMSFSNHNTHIRGYGQSSSGRSRSYRSSHGGRTSTRRGSRSGDFSDDEDSGDDRTIVGHGSRHGSSRTHSSRQESSRNGSSRHESFGSSRYGPSRAGGSRIESWLDGQPSRYGSTSSRHEPSSHHSSSRSSRHSTARHSTAHHSSRASYYPSEDYHSHSSSRASRSSHSSAYPSEDSYSHSSSLPSRPSQSSRHGNGSSPGYVNGDINIGSSFGMSGGSSDGFVSGFMSSTYDINGHRGGFYMPF